MERKNRALKEMTAWMIEAKYLATNIWGEAMNVSSSIHNMFPHSSMKLKMPFKAWFGHKLDVSNFKALGSTSWARIPLDKRKSSQP